MNKSTNTWPFAEGTRIEVGAEIQRVIAADPAIAEVLKDLSFVDIARQMAWCDSQAKAARKLQDLSAGKVTADQATQIVSKAYEQRIYRVKNNKSDQDVTVAREK